jgi:hypothetical protein
MKIRRVVLTEEPYPTCAVSGKQLGNFGAVYEITREDGTVVYVDYKTFIALEKS